MPKVRQRLITLTAVKIDFVGNWKPLNENWKGAMPRDPRGEKRPTDVIGNAVHVMSIATSEGEEGEHVDDGKGPAAKALGRRGAGKVYVAGAAGGDC